GENRGVDANQLAAQVHQCAAGIARVDGGVRLDEILVAVGVDARAGQAADDAGGDRVLQAEGVADGEHKVADLNLGRVAESDLHQAAVAFDFQHGNVRRLVASDDLGLQIAAVLEGNGDFARVLHHVS